MTEIIVIGHGQYAEGIRTNLEMVVGVPENMHFLNFSLGQERTDLEENLKNLLEKLGGAQILFCCDLPGATPFQVAALETAQDLENRATVLGMNSMAFMELAMDPQGTPAELARRAVETTRESTAIFPE